MHYFTTEKVCGVTPLTPKENCTSYSAVGQKSIPPRLEKLTTSKCGRFVHRTDIMESKVEGETLSEETDEGRTKVKSTASKRGRFVHRKDIMEIKVEGENDTPTIKRY